MAAAAYNEMVAYIRDAAIKRGIDPDVALRVAQAEALNVFDPSQPDRGGDEGSSFGPFQLHYKGMSKSMPNAGLGDEFTAATGLDARDPSTWKQQVDFSLDHAAKKGWTAWMGAKAKGIAPYQGIAGGEAPRVSGPVEAAGGGAGSETGTAAGGKEVKQLTGFTPAPTVVVAPQPMEAPSTSPVDTNNPWSGLASGLASSVKKDNSMLSGGGQEQAPLPTPEFASALPQAQPLQPVGLDLSPLADLFGTVDIGQAGAMNVDPYGNPIRRRQYG